MAIRQSRATGAGRSSIGPGFVQSQQLNAQLPYLNSMIAGQQARKMRMEDTAFREKEYNQAVSQHQDQMRLEKQKRKEAEDAARTAMGLRGAEFGLGMVMNKDVGGKLLMGPSGILGGQERTGILGGLNLGNTVGAMLTGGGLASLTKKTPGKIGLGLAGGALAGLIGSGPGQGLTSALTGAGAGGVGALLSGLV